MQEVLGKGKEARFLRTEGPCAGRRIVLCIVHVAFHKKQPLDKIELPSQGSQNCRRTIQ